MEITLVKAAGPGDQDRVWLTVDGATRCGAIHVVHDLPHLVVESLFGMQTMVSGMIPCRAAAWSSRWSIWVSRRRGGGKAALAVPGERA
jgi:hypothetical protein